ncbi:MAG: endonuclease/exonuclease/phosphatase family protein [Chitinophagaceae bacterium]|nr:endonuclease/exonuclease/phosphatase family protein [Chitinophagaceae bacterium]MCW5927225.1 endonuclease/exonuclease/phosphatase family protein [Chitinophagaceae bacterium]
MKYYISFVLLLLASGAGAQTRMKILSYNIFHGENPYTKQPNADSVAALINFLQPDLVALQEVDSATGRSEKIYGSRVDYVQLLAKKTGMTGHFGKAMDYDGGGYGEGLLSNKKLAAQTIILPTPSGGEPRAAISVSYPLLSGKELTFIATHLCHQFLPNKIAQVQKVNEQFAEKKQAAILAGDLNFKPDDAPYKELATQWIDAAADRNPQPTYSTDNPRIRIDYFWLSRKQNWKVIDFQVLPYEYSDHKPILLTVEIQ